MPSLHRIIWNKFHIHDDTIKPLRAWEGSRITLAELFNDLGYKLGAEIGVEQGKYSSVLLDKNPNLKLKCVDPWEPYGRQSVDRENRLYDETIQRLTPYRDRVEIIRKKSIDAVKEVPNGSLDFVYIDALHDFDNVMMDLIHWVPKVRRGGIVSGHDYTITHGFGIVQAVESYTRYHSIGLYYITKDTDSSFFWVQP